MIGNYNTKENTIYKDKLTTSFKLNINMSILYFDLNAILFKLFSLARLLMPDHEIIKVMKPVLNLKILLEVTVHWND